MYKLKKKSFNDKQIQGRSTRSIGPSWALFKGASIRDIMESADWSRETTFIKHFLKTVKTPVLKVLTYISLIVHFIFLHIYYIYMAVILPGLGGVTIR